MTNRYCRWMMLLVMVMSSMVYTIAQKNRAGINDDMFVYYNKGDKALYSKSAMAYADTMLIKAREIGDAKGECLAWFLKLRHIAVDEEIRYQDVSSFYDEFREVATRSNLIQYYYFSSLLEAKKLASENMILDALRLATKVGDEAYKAQHQFGIYSFHEIMGHIYKQRNMYRSALKEYQEACACSCSISDLATSFSYYNCAVCHFGLMDYDKALEVVEEASRDDRMSRRIELLLLGMKTKIYYYTGDVRAYRVSYNRFNQMKRLYGIHKLDIDYELVALDLIDKGKNQEAIKYYNDSLPLLARLEGIAMVYHRMGDDHIANKYLDSVRLAQLSLYDDAFNDDLASVNALFEHETLKLHNDELETERHLLAVGNNELELQKKQLELDNERLELDKASSFLELQAVQLDNKNLEYNNKSLLHDKAQREMDNKRALLEKENSRKEMADVILNAVMIVLVLIMVGVSILLLVREKMYRKLNVINGELSEAKKIAEENMKNAEWSERRKSLFIQSMSHEVRTPLNAICGFSQILTDPEMMSGMDRQQRDGLTEMILNNTEMLITIVNDILYVSDLESGKFKMKMSEISCIDICKNALRDVIDKKKTGVEITFATNVCNDFKIKTDGERIQQVLRNFLSNSMKYTDRGEICLSCVVDDEHPNYVVFSVTDTGSGVPADKADVIFDRFEKLDDFKQGTGLGLTICRLIAEKLNGQVYLDTTYTQGARFVFLHPIDYAGINSFKLTDKKNGQTGKEEIV